MSFWSSPSKFAALRTAFKGSSTNIVKDCIGFSLFFSVYEFMRRQLNENYHDHMDGHRDSQPITLRTFGEAFVAGATAGGL